MTVNGAGALLEWIIAISMVVGPALVLFALGYALGKKTNSSDSRLGLGCAGGAIGAFGGIVALLLSS